MTPSERAGHESIIHTQGRTGTWRFRRDGGEVSVAVTGRPKLSSAEGIRTAVLADMGIAIASRWMFAPELAFAGVCVLLGDWALDPIPAGRLVSAKARAFADLVAAATRAGNG